MSYKRLLSPSNFTLVFMHRNSQNINFDSIFLYRKWKTVLDFIILKNNYEIKCVMRLGLKLTSEMCHEVEWFENNFKCQDCTLLSINEKKNHIIIHKRSSIMEKIIFIRLYLEWYITYLFQYDIQLKLSVTNFCINLIDLL